MRSLCLCLLLCMPAAVVAAPAPALPGNSVYHLAATLTDHNGRTQAFAARRGRPQLVTMFYTSCQMVCPLIVESMRRTHAALPPAMRAQIDLLAISFDPANDDVVTLREYARQRQLQAGVWTLARVEPAQVRQLAGVLGVQYRQLPDGEFNHSSVLILLDAEGRIVARAGADGGVDQAFVQTIQRTLGGS